MTHFAFTDLRTGPLCVDPGVKPVQRALVWMDGLHRRKPLLVLLGMLFAGANLSTPK